MAQMLLLPDPKPLDKRPGKKFFCKVPRRPGVYLMKDGQGEVVFVGKGRTNLFCGLARGSHGVSFPLSAASSKRNWKRSTNLVRRKSRTKNAGRNRRCSDISYPWKFLAAWAVRDRAERIGNSEKIDMGV